MHTRHVILVLASMAAVTLARPQYGGADDNVREYDIEAAFVYNFTQFVTWPSDALGAADAPFVVAVVGADPFRGALDQAMGGKTVESHPIIVKHFASTDDLGPCHLLYVPRTQENALSNIFQKIGKNPVLTVDETEQFLAAGGSIRFFVDNKRMRFEINPAATDAGGLKVSSKLLKLARIYKS